MDNESMKMPCQLEICVLSTNADTYHYKPVCSPSVLLIFVLFAKSP